MKKRGIFQLIYTCFVVVFFFIFSKNDSSVSKQYYQHFSSSPWSKI